MTVTTDAPAAAPAAESTAPAPKGLAALLGSGDHKVVGRLWLGVAMLHLLLLGVSTTLVNVEGIDSSSFSILDQHWAVQLDTFRLVSLVFLFLVPLTIAVATAIVPLQVGAPTLAFPRAAAAAAWTYLLAGGLLVASYCIDGGPDGTKEKGSTLFVVAFVLLLLALLVAWICIATTVITLRVWGLRLVRVPLFAWSALVAGAVWVITLPVLAGYAVLSYLDVRYDFALGGGAGTVYGRIAWAFGVPAVFAVAIPVLGFAGSVVPVAFQTRHVQHRAALGLIGAFGVLAVGVWAVPSLTGATPWLYEGPWVVVSFALVVPVLGLLGLWALTARQGTLKLSSPLLYGVLSSLLLLVAVAAGAVQAIKPLKTIVDGPGTSLHGTAWSLGILGFASLAGIVAMVGAVVYWAPKLLGTSINEAGARLLAPVLFLGALLNAGAELVGGLLGQPGSSVVNATDNVDTIETLSVVATVGALVLMLGGLLFVLLLLKAAVSKDRAEDDPWGGHTLEWATTSPPPRGNFSQLPTISSEAPLYDARHGQEAAR